MYIPPLYSQSTVLVAASNHMFLILWAEIHYLCSQLCTWFVGDVPGYVLLWGCFLWNDIEEDGSVLKKKKSEVIGGRVFFY
jgi:hypothetical protein